MPVTVTSTPALTTSYTNLYSGLKIKPDISFNNNTGSIWSDDNILTVGTNNDTTLAMTTAVSAVQNVPSGSTFRSIDLLDHLDIGGGAYVQTNGDIYVLGGCLAVPNVTPAELINGYYHFLSGASTNWNFSLATNSASTITVPQFDQTTVSIGGGNITATNAQNFASFTMSGVAFNIATISTTSDFNLSGGAFTGQSLTVGGNLNITGGTMNHPATTTTTIYRLEAVVTGSFTMSGTGRINVDTLGYPSGYSFGSSGPSTALFGPLNHQCGASHGGTGGYNVSGCPTLATALATYDDYRNPNYPSGGSYNGGGGGGVVRLTAAGICTINSGASVTANPKTTSYQAAGGSIYLKCAGFAGNAGTGAINASGSSYDPGGTYSSGGGGGRIALISTGDSSSWNGSFTYPNSSNNVTNFKTVVRAWGGVGASRIALTSTGDASSWTGSFAYPSSSANLTNFKTIVRAYGGAQGHAVNPAGGAGSIYLKHSGLTYGDLIIDNGGQSSGGGYTNLISSTANTNHLDSSPNTTTAQITSGATPLANMTNLFSNYLLQIFPTNSSGVGLDPANNLPLITLNGNGTNNFTTATGTFPSINANYDYRFVYQLDHLDIGGKAIVNAQGADIYLMSADTCDLHSTTTYAFDVPSGSSLTGNSFSAPYCKSGVGYLSGSVTFTNNFMQP